MKRGTRMQPVDSAGLPNYAPGRARIALCPVCGDRPETKGGVSWKWLAIHLAKHLGFSWSERGWATISTDTASSTTTRSDER